MIVALDEQSPDIAQGVDAAYEVQHDAGAGDPLDRVGAGDQGMMFGYASNETPELMPLPIMLAHKICKRLSEVRKADVLPYLRPDGKAQVSVRYEVAADGRRLPVAVENILVSTQHRDGLDADTLIKPDVIEHVLRPILPHDLVDERRWNQKDFVYVNPTGKFVIGGPMGDTGLTGRKIIVDTYGGAAPHGGGAFSGKDPTKVDRSAAYAARYVAKNIVAAGLADRCQIQVAYAIGVARPFSIHVECFGTEHEDVPVARIEELVAEHFDLRPAAILRDLDLRRPIYTKTAAYGHFGRDDHDFTWERTDKADAPCAPPPVSRPLAYAARTNRPAAAFSPIAFSTPPTPHAELARGRLGRMQLDLGARHEALLVEPVQQVAVVLGQADDRGVRARREPGQRRELVVLGHLEVGIDRPAVRAALGMAELRRRSARPCRR